MDKMPCLRAYAPSGIRTHDPRITSREHDPLYHSAPTWCSSWMNDEFPAKRCVRSHRSAGHPMIYDFMEPQTSSMFLTLLQNLAAGNGCHNGRYFQHSQVRLIRYVGQEDGVRQGAAHNDRQVGAGQAGLWEGDVKGLVAEKPTHVSKSYHVRGDSNQFMGQILITLTQDHYRVGCQRSCLRITHPCE